MEQDTKCDIKRDKKYYEVYNSGAYDVLTDVLKNSEDMSKTELVNLMQTWREYIKMGLDENEDEIWGSIIDSVTVPKQEHFNQSDPVETD